MRSVPLAAFTAAFNTTGQPAISLPVHRTADGVPVGARLVDAYGREDQLIRAAEPWAERWPSARRDPAGHRLSGPREGR